MNCLLRAIPSLPPKGVFCWIFTQGELFVCGTLIPPLNMEAAIPHPEHKTNASEINSLAVSSERHFTCPNVGMDVPRPAGRSQRIRRRIAYGCAAVAASLILIVGVSWQKAPHAVVERSPLWIDTVKRGPMLRQVHGLGTLSPIAIRWIPATTEGRVERILVLPGASVQSNTTLLELSNPQLQQEALDSQLKLTAAEADSKRIEAQLASQILAQQGEAARLQSEYSQAKMQADIDAKLANYGITPDLTRRFSTTKADELKTRKDIEEQRLADLRKVLDAQLQAERAYVQQYRALANLKSSQLATLQVSAGIPGVLQELPLKVGQWVTPGTNLAKVVQPDKLQAEIKIPETQARDVQIGQTVSIDTHNGLASGQVTEIDPSVQNGTVTVQVALDGQLPRGARPDLSVDGTINLEQIPDALYVGRPALGQEHSTIDIFKIEPGSSVAVRSPIRIGRTSVNSIEVLEGLREGDQVILSDMSHWDGFDRIQLD
jgi:HlyD family secretion protein